jgi:hypothetical protein
MLGEDALDRVASELVTEAAERTNITAMKFARSSRGREWSCDSESLIHSGPEFSGIANDGVTAPGLRCPCGGRGSVVAFVADATLGEHSRALGHFR